MKMITINLPRSWEELTDKQLYYVYNLISDNLSLPQIKTLCFMRWGNLRVDGRVGDNYIIIRGKDKFSVSHHLIADAIHSLDWINDSPATPVRISRIGGKDALDASFYGVPYEKYLYLDNLYQGYLATQSHSLLEQMFQILYDSQARPNKTEKISVFYWWCSLKSLFSRSFPHFFQTANTDNSPEENIHQKLKDAMNAQIRALTKGDITKEAEVLKMDVWRALTELDAIAYENQELDRKYGKKM